MDLGTLARALKGHRSGASWVAHCPAHEDRNPSLSLSTATNGNLLVHCHAGCPQAAVIHALKDLGAWPEQLTQRNLSHIIVAYDYTDEAGTLLYQVVRTEPKSFFQRYPDGRGGWINRKCARQVLYQLPRLLSSPIVFVVEGEKDADRLIAEGFIATTNSGGANARWLPEYSETLRGKEVILIPDNDPPGRKRVETIGRDLVGSAEVTVLALEGCKDVSDWLDKGHSELELIHLIES